MIIMPSAKRGFTIIELLVVIVIIGLLSAVATVSYRGVQQDARDTERDTDTQIISTALESYYDRNGHYPGGAAVSGSNTSNFFQQDLNIPERALVAPGGTNSIVYTNSNDSSEVHLVNRYHYRSTTSAGGSCSGSDCARFQIRYKTESDGSNITLESRYGW